jgi:hypothetical protein
MGQNQQVSPNETIGCMTTNDARESVLFGDIGKFAAAGMLQIIEGNPFYLKQVTVSGQNVNGLLGLKDVLGIVSIIALVSATGAYATKALLDGSGYTADYVKDGVDIKCLTNQSANKLIVSYWSL